jgi:uncharacterized membrane protein YphA (DoxX/SURF4 family)
MSILCFAIELYFAMMLSVSGISKLSDLQHFKEILYKQHILPLWSIKWISKIVPGIEIGLASLLVMGIAEKIVAVAVVMLFALFLVVKIFLLATKNNADCGCNSRSKVETVDGASIVVAVIFILLAAFHMGLLLSNVSVTIFWRLIGTIFIVALSGFLLVGSRIRYRQFSRLASQEAEVGSQQPVFFSRDHEGNTLTIKDY